MEEARHRLQKARAAFGFNSPTEAARAFPRNLNQNTLISHENGNRPISKKAAEKYARLFNVDAGWLLYGTPTQPPSPQKVNVPVLSLVSAGDLRFVNAVQEHEVLRWLEVPDLPKGEWVALIVDGDSMDRIAPPGSTILIDRSDTVLLDGRFYVFAVDGGEASFKMYRRDPSRLQPYSTNPNHMATPADVDDIYVFGRVKRVINDI